MQKTREVRWEHMFPDELEAAFTACPVVFMPYGLCEPHGPQNAVGLDGLKAHGICCAAARDLEESSRQRIIGMCMSVVDTQSGRRKTLVNGNRG